MSRSNKPLLRVLAGETVGPPPIWLMRQAGRYLPEYRALRAKAGSFLDLCFNPALATEVTLQPIERYAFDAAILFSDILVVPHALGQGVRFVEGEGPRLDAIRDPGGVAELSLAAMTGADTPLAPVYETVERVRTALPETVALIGFAGAPWTVATYMVEGGTSRDFHNIKQWAASDDLGFAALIEILVEATAAHLAHQAEAGAEVVQLFESHAGV
ncbi:MAG: uroporphyrinogen decarboxylase, partial [Alphaproteobacteria bacterium]|nr:uroporphyrinogen decarboxylase [Alphaproteobacteria bacterium]